MKTGDTDYKYEIDGQRLVITYTETNSSGEKFIRSHNFIHLDDNITEIVIPEGVVSIGSWSLMCYPNLRHVVIPDSLKEIGAWTFNKCPLLDEAIVNQGKLLFVPNHTEGVFSIPDGVTQIGEDAFTGCWSLQSVIVPEGVQEIPNYCFAACKSLESVILPRSVTVIGQHAFGGCGNLREINLPDGMKDINESTFCGCESLTKITIPESVESISEGAFLESGLEEIFIPDNVKFIGDEAFRECEHLKNARLPEGVKIGTNAFYGCTAWAAAPENKAELENSLQINGISINQYKSWCSLDYRVYLLADIISQIPDCYRLSMGTEFAIVSDQGDCDRMHVVRGLDDNLETVNYNMRLWTEIPYGRNGMEIHWTCFCEDEIVTDGNVTGPLELGNGITRLSCTKKEGWKIVTPASRRGNTPPAAQLMGKIAKEISGKVGKVEIQAPLKK